MHMGAPVQLWESENSIRQPVLSVTMWGSNSGLQFGSKSPYLLSHLIHRSPVSSYKEVLSLAVRLVGVSKSIFVSG